MYMISCFCLAIFTAHLKAPNGPNLQVSASEFNSDNSIFSIVARIQFVSIISITYSSEASLLRYRFAMIPNFVEVENICFNNYFQKLCKYETLMPPILFYYCLPSGVRCLV
jgi:hypothetical protein